MILAWASPFEGSSKQQTRDIEPLLVQCWSSVIEPTMAQCLVFAALFIHVPWIK